MKTQKRPTGRVGILSTTRCSIGYLAFTLCNVVSRLIIKLQVELGSVKIVRG